MNDLVQFLTSKEIIIVYMISGLSCLICLIVYFVERNNEKLRRRHNTKQLNKLVEKIQEKVEIENEEDSQDYHEEPVLQVIEDNNSYEESLSDEGLVYTSIEPDVETAKAEIKKLEEQLIQEEEKKEEVQVQEVEEVTTSNDTVEVIEDREPQEDIVDNNVRLNDYEEEQEATAIISLEELVKKGKEIYAANELSQYKDEGNEPISIQDLEAQQQRKVAAIEEPFIIENVVDDNIEELEILDDIDDKKVVLDDFNTIKLEEEKVNVNDVKIEKKFQNSPIISPIFGIERLNNIEPNDLELENTANYEKLDEEIRKTNEFIMTLKELQSKLD